MQLYDRCYHILEQSGQPGISGDKGRRVWQLVGIRPPHLRSHICSLAHHGKDIVIVALPNVIARDLLQLVGSAGYLLISGSVRSVIVSLKYRSALFSTTASAGALIGVLVSLLRAGFRVMSIIRKRSVDSMS